MFCSPTSIDLNVCLREARRDKGWFLSTIRPRRPRALPQKITMKTNIAWRLHEIVRKSILSGVGNLHRTNVGASGTVPHTSGPTCKGLWLNAWLFQARVRRARVQVSHSGTMANIAAFVLLTPMLREVNILVSRCQHHRDDFHLPCTDCIDDDCRPDRSRPELPTVPYRSPKSALSLGLACGLSRDTVRYFHHEFEFHAFRIGKVKVRPEA